MLPLTEGEKNTLHSSVLPENIGKIRGYALSERSAYGLEAGK